MNSKLRAGFWREKRVFFLTPQVVQNDLTANICPADAVKCVVIDEAHRALGDHAYAQVKATVSVCMSNILDGGLILMLSWHYCRLFVSSIPMRLVLGFLLFLPHQAVT